MSFALFSIANAAAASHFEMFINADLELVRNMTDWLPSKR